MDQNFEAREPEEDEERSLGFRLKSLERLPWKAWPLNFKAARILFSLCEMRLRILDKVSRRFKRGLAPFKVINLSYRYSLYRMVKDIACAEGMAQ